MKKIIKTFSTILLGIVLITAVVTLPEKVYARDAISSDTYIVTDTGDTVYNGTYTYISDCLGNPMFGNGTNHMSVAPNFPAVGTNSWIMATGLTCNAGALDYKQLYGFTNLDPTTASQAWTNHDGHALPAPTVTLSGGTTPTFGDLILFGDW